MAEPALRGLAAPLFFFIVLISLTGAGPVQADPGSLVYFSNHSRDLYEGDDSFLAVDNTTRITDYRFHNGTATVTIDTDIPQIVKVTAPFTSSFEKRMVYPGESEFTVPCRPYRGINLVGVVTINGEVYVKESASALGVPEHPIIIAYSELTRQLWKYIALGILVLFLGFYVNRAFSSICYHKLKSPITIFQVVLFLLAFSILFGIDVTQAVDHDRVKVAKDVYETVDNQITFYDFNMGDAWRYYMRILFVLPFAGGMLLSRSVTRYNPINIFQFGDKVGYFELRQSESGFCTDRQGRVCMYNFQGSDMETLELNEVGEAVLATDVTIEDFPPPRTPPNKDVGYFALVEAAFYFISKEFMGFKVHPVYLGVLLGLYYLAKNWESVSQMLGLYPRVVYSIKCSPLMTEDNVSREVREGTNRAMVDGYDDLRRALISTSVEGPFEITKELLKINDLLLEQERSHKGKKFVSLEDDKEDDPESELMDILESGGFDGMSEEEIEREVVKRFGGPS